MHIFHSLPASNVTRMRPETAYSFVVFATALSLSTLLWFGPLYFTGGIDENLAVIVLFELPFIFFYHAVVNGSQRASLATGVLMGITGLLWLSVFDISPASHSPERLAIGSMLFLGLVAVIVLVKFSACFIALFSPGFRVALQDRRARDDEGKDPP